MLGEVELSSGHAVAIDNVKYAFALARAVDLLRKSAEPGEPQKAALRALVGAAAERSATFRFYDTVLTIDNEPIATSDPRLTPFAERLTAQQVAEVVIARGADPSELLALCTGLAQDPNQGRIKERLRDAGSSRVMVVLHTPDTGHRPPSVTGAFAKVKLDQAVMAEWNKFLDQGAKTATDRQVDLGIVAPTGGADSSAPPGEKQISFDGPAAPRPVFVAGQFTPISTKQAAPPPSPAPLPPPPPAAPVNVAPTSTNATPLSSAIAALQASPYGADTLTKLTVTSRHIEDAFKADRVPEALTACVALIDLENKAPDPARNSYGVILKRILTRSSLAQAAPYLLEPRRKERAASVMKRGGEDSVVILVGLLGAAQSLGERVTYLEVLRTIATGVDRVLALLSRSEWLVVRNTAETAGEVRLEAAVPYLARLTEHADERVRRSAIVALAKIGNAATVEPLRSALQGSTPELRALIVSNIGGPQARPLTGPLSTLADSEDNPEVIRAYYKAIARIGTPEARAVLERATGSKTIFSRRGKVAREAAEEALRTFGT